MPTVRTNDIETYYERRGEGPPVVFVHAAILDRTQWDAQVDVLSDEYSVITYDVRGHGRTGGSAVGRYSIELFADDLAALIDALDLEKPVVCGFSTGGCIAQVYAARHPDRLAGLVLSDTFTPELLSPLEWLQRSVIPRATIPPARIFGYERVEKVMVWVQERIAGEEFSGDYGNVEKLRETGPSMETDEFAKVIRALAFFHRSAVDLTAISVPTLVMYGENEAGFVRTQAARLGAEIPDATVRVIPGGGHASNLDNPEFFTNAVRGLLADAYPAEAAEMAGESGE
ncbi:alpha/beta fold hydrolase [Halosimplex amylolyticum]|uniref:alpha/beta fold hydrolase n=1 Tax=Halosimplex amylolyticum TaxID=3396616 RepID=UPI003F5597AF